METHDTGEPKQATEVLTAPGSKVIVVGGIEVDGKEHDEWRQAPKRHGIRMMLLFLDFLAVLIYVHYFMIRSVVRDANEKGFSLVSNKMLSYYGVLLITGSLVFVALVLKFRKAERSRLTRENVLRADPIIPFWVMGFDWGWPIVFVPSMILMVIFGMVGLFLNWALHGAPAVERVEEVMGGIFIFFGTLNALAAVFKLRLSILLLVAGFFFAVLFIMLLNGMDTFVNFFRSFRHLGVQVEPLGYLILAYVWFIFLRVIWLRGLFYYWVFTPNSLEVQAGLAESVRTYNRVDVRPAKDTDNVVLRAFGLGMIIFSFPRDPGTHQISSLVSGVGRKAQDLDRVTEVRNVT